MEESGSRQALVGLRPGEGIPLILCMRLGVSGTPYVRGDEEISIPSANSATYVRSPSGIYFLRAYVGTIKT